MFFLASAIQLFDKIVFLSAASSSAHALGAGGPTRAPD